MSNRYSPSNTPPDRPLKSPPAAQISDSNDSVSILRCLLEIEKTKNIELSNRIVILEGIIRSVHENDTEVDLKPVLTPVRLIREDGKPVTEKSGLMSRFFKLVFGHDT